MSQDTINSVSGSIDEKSRALQHRHSFQNQKTNRVVVSVHPVRRHSSLGKNKSGNSLRKPSVPDILEYDKDEEDGNKTEVPNHSNLATPSAATTENIRISFTKKNRKISNISRTSKISAQNGVNNNDRGNVNYGYDVSTRSSTHGSMSSLP